MRFLKYLIGGTVGCLVLYLGGCAILIGLGVSLAMQVPQDYTEENIQREYGGIINTVEERLEDGQPLGHQHWAPESPERLLGIYDKGFKAEMYRKYGLTKSGHAVVNRIGIAKVRVDNESMSAVVYGIEDNDETYYLILRDWRTRARPPTGPDDKKSAPR